MSQLLPGEAGALSRELAPGRAEEGGAGEDRPGEPTWGASASRARG